MQFTALRPFPHAEGQLLWWPRGTLANCVLHQIASAFCVPASAFCVHDLIRFYVLRSWLGTLLRSAFATRHASMFCVLCFRILRSPLPLAWYLVHLRLDPLLCSQLSPLLFALLLHSAFLFVLLFSSAFCTLCFPLDSSSSAFCVLRSAA